MMKKLREEGFDIGRYRVRNLMRKRGLKVTQRVAYRVTTQRKHSGKGVSANTGAYEAGCGSVWALLQPGTAAHSQR
jgi:putative transposase